MSHLNGVEITEKVVTIVAVTGIAMLGGIAKSLHRSLVSGSPIQRTRVIAQAIVSMFTGYIFFEAAHVLGRPEYGQFIAGLGGYWGAEGMDYLIKKFQSKWNN